MIKPTEKGINNHENEIGSLSYEEDFESKLGNSDIAEKHLTDWLNDFAEKYNLDWLNEAEVHNMVLGFREAFINAVVHGNKNDQSKTVTVRLKIKPKQVEIVIKNEGEWQNWQEAMDRYEKLIEKSEAEPIAIMERGGRGLFMIKKYFNQVGFNERGNEITMVRNGSEPSPFTVELEELKKDS